MGITPTPEVSAKPPSKANIAQLNIDEALAAYQDSSKPFAEVVGRTLGLNNLTSKQAILAQHQNSLPWQGLVGPFERATWRFSAATTSHLNQLHFADVFHTATRRYNWRWLLRFGTFPTLSRGVRYLHVGRFVPGMRLIYRKPKRNIDYCDPGHPSRSNSVAEYKCPSHLSTSTISGDDRWA